MPSLLHVSSICPCRNEGEYRYPALVLLFLLTSSCGLIFGNASALALNEARHMAGSASAVMGTVQAMLGAVAAPLVSIAGEHEYLPMGFSILGFAVLTALVLWTTPRKDSDYSADGLSHGAGEGQGAPAAGH